jgi:hypothetical protein
MDIDWDLVKKETLWDYQQLVQKLLNTLDYPFVLEYYDHTMPQAAIFAQKVQLGYLQGRPEPPVGVRMRAIFNHLHDLHIASYLTLLQRISNREKCERFLVETGFSFNELVATLNYLFRWVLPFMAPIREFLPTDDETEMRFLEPLKRAKLATNLALMEQGRHRDGRKSLSAFTGLPETLLVDLVHRADISRLAYVRGKTVLHLCRSGYNTLDKLAGADLIEIEQAMDAYYCRLGKSLADYKAAISISWIIGGARILPRIVEV